MQPDTTITENQSLAGLVRTLPQEMKLLCKQEIGLAKAELSEKFSELKAGLVKMAAGAVAALLAASLVLMSLGFIVSYGFEALDLAPSLSRFLGFLIVGLATATAGYILMRRSTTAFSSEKLTPEKTIEAMKMSQVVGPSPARTTAAIGHNGRSSDRKFAEVNRTQVRMHNELMEIQRRLAPKYIFTTALPCQMKLHPLRSAVIAGVSGLASFLYLKRRMIHRHSEAKI